MATNKPKDAVPRTVVVQILEREIAARADTEHGGRAAIVQEMVASGLFTKTSAERRLYSLLTGHTGTRDKRGRLMKQKWVQYQTVEKILIAIGREDLWHTEIAEAQQRKRHSHARLSEKDLRDLHRRHIVDQLSVRALCRELVAAGTYSHVNCAYDAIHTGWQRFGMSARNRIDATRLASITHGYLVGAKSGTRLAQKGRNRYKRWHRRTHGRWASDKGPTGEPVRDCKGTKTTIPQVGRACRLPAMMDSDYCYAHDPRFQAENRERLVRARATMLENRELREAA